MNNFHGFQNFRQFSNLFSQIRLKKRHTSLFSRIYREIRTNCIKNSQKNAKFDRKNEKIGNSIFIREKMLTIFGWNFEIWVVQKYVNLSFSTSVLFSKRRTNVNLVDLVKSFQRVYTKSCKNRRRYSRERASQRLEENSIHYSFASLLPSRSGGVTKG